MKNPHESDFELKVRPTSKLTLDWLRLQSTEYLTESLVETGLGEQLEWNQNGVVLEGNHRIHVLKERGVDVHEIARQVWNRKFGGNP